MDRELRKMAEDKSSKIKDTPKYAMKSSMRWLAQAFCTNTCQDVQNDNTNMQMLSMVMRDSLKTCLFNSGVTICSHWLVLSLEKTQI